MLRNLTLALVPLFSLSIAACATPVEDELAGDADTEDTVDGKADGAPGGTYTYYAIRADLRRCAFPLCGGFFVDRVNASKTTCHDGTKAEACYTPVLDWSEANLSQAQQDALVGKAGSLGDGVHALVRGRFAKAASPTTQEPNLGRFIVTEAWVAEGEGASDGVFAKVADNGIRCIAAPCPTLTEKALNASRRADIAEVDYTAGTYTDAALERLSNDLFAPSGIIIAGDRFNFTFQGRAGKGRTATQAYRNLANEAPPAGECFVGGCSGQVCSDQPGVISTCEWRPEYACYDDAACARQANGECGWTPSPELAACLANPPQL